MSKKRLGVGSVIASVILIIVSLAIGIVPMSLINLILGITTNGGSVASSDPWGLGLNGSTYKVNEKTDGNGHVVYQQARHKKDTGTYMYRGNGSYVYVYRNAEDGEQYVQVFCSSKTAGETGYVTVNGDKLVSIEDGYDADALYLWAKTSDYKSDPSSMTTVRQENSKGTYSQFALDEMEVVYETQTASVPYDVENGRYATVYTYGGVEYVIAYIEGEGYAMSDDGDVYGDSEEPYEGATYRFVKYTGTETYIFASVEELEASEDEVEDILFEDVTAVKLPEYNQIVGDRYAYLNLYETAAPWDTDAKLDGEAYSDAALIGNDLTVINPYTGEELTVTVPTDLTDVKWDDLTEAQQNAHVSTDALKKLALALYYKANYNYVMADYSGNYMNAATSNVAAGLDNAIDLTSMEFRKSGSYFTLTEIHTIRNSLLVDTMPSLKSLLPLEYGERKYLDDTRDTVLAQKTKSAGIENGKYTVPWYTDVDQDALTERTPSSPEQLTYGEADGDVTCYTFGVNVLDLDTVTVAYVAYVDGKFEIHMELDAKGEGTEIPKAVKNSLQGVRDGAGDPTAQYQYVNYDITLWKDGSYKSVRQKENWLGKAAGFEVNGLFDYYYVFFYGKENANPETVEKVNADWTEVAGSFIAYEEE